MAENEEKINFSQTGAWEQIMASRLNYAGKIRQSNPENVKDGVAGLWSVLRKKVRQKLSKKIGDGRRNEYCFHELYQQVLDNDLKEKINEDMPREKKIIRACEYILTKIANVLEEEGAYGRGSVSSGVLLEEKE